MRSSDVLYIRKIRFSNFIFNMYTLYEKIMDLSPIFLAWTIKCLSSLKAQIRALHHSHFKLKLGNLSFIWSTPFISLSFFFSSASRHSQVRKVRLVATAREGGGPREKVIHAVRNDGSPPCYWPGNSAARKKQAWSAPTGQTPILLTRSPFTISRRDTWPCPIFSYRTDTRSNLRQTSDETENFNKQKKREKKISEKK